MLGFRSAAELLTEVEAILGKDQAEPPSGPEPTRPASNDPRAHLEFADALAARGRHAEALAEYLWCLDEGARHDPAFAPQRRSTVPARIARLATEYPPALEALAGRRDALEAEVLGGRARFDAILDYTSLVEAIGDRRRLVAVFDKLPGDSMARRLIFAAALDELLAARRYADIVSFEDPGPAVQRKIEDYHALRQAPGGFDAAVHEAAIKSAADRIRDYGAKMVEALAGAGKRDDARAMIEVMLKFDPSDSMRQALHERLTRGGEPELAASVKGP